MGSALVLKAKYHMKEKSQHETRKTLGDKEKKMTLSSVDMAEAHALTLRKSSDLAFYSMKAELTEWAFYLLFHLLSYWALLLIFDKGRVPPKKHMIPLCFLFLYILFVDLFLYNIKIKVIKLAAMLSGACIIFRVLHKRSKTAYSSTFVFYFCLSLFLFYRGEYYTSS